MGCGCRSNEDINIQHNGRNITIKAKDARTLGKYAHSANAKIAVKNKKVALAMEIASIQKPVWKMDPLNTESKKHLISSSEFEKILKELQGGNSLVWINYFNNISTGVDYKGQYDQDRKTINGIGTLRYQRGANTNDTYQGQVKTINGKVIKEGRGQMVYADGTVYWGDWKDDQWGSVGVFAEGNCIFDGQFQNQQKQGKGIEKYKTKVGTISVYIGEFLEGLKSGNGKQRTYDPTGSYDLFQGTFSKGMSTEGKIVFHDGREYTGQMSDNLMEGWGVMKFPDNNRYDGNFKRGKIHGQGTMRFTKKGDKYVGNFQNGLNHGKGIFFNFKDQNKRQGEWQKGKRVKWLAAAQESYINKNENPELLVAQAAQQKYIGARRKVGGALGKNGEDLNTPGFASRQMEQMKTKKKTKKGVNGTSESVPESPLPKTNQKKIEVHFNDAFSVDTYDWEIISTKFKESIQEPSHIQIDPSQSQEKMSKQNNGLEKIESIPITDKSLQVVIIDSEQVDVIQDQFYKDKTAQKKIEQRKQELINTEKELKIDESTLEAQSHKMNLDVNENAIEVNNRLEQSAQNAIAPLIVPSSIDDDVVEVQQEQEHFESAQGQLDQTAKDIQQSSALELTQQKVKAEQNQHIEESALDDPTLTNLGAPSPMAMDPYEETALTLQEPYMQPSFQLESAEQQAIRLEEIKLESKQDDAAHEAAQKEVANVLKDLQDERAKIEKDSKFKNSPRVKI